MRSGKLLPYRTAAECIDWSIPCPSIFERKRELADATKRRIAHGVMRYVVNAAKPFIVGAGGPVYGGKPRSTAEPMGTVMVDEHKAAVDVEIAPHITKFRTGSVGSPMDKGSQGAVATATMVEAGFIDRQFTRSTPDSAEQPMGASTTHNHSAAASVFLSSFYGSDKRGAGGDPGQPTRTARAGGQHHAVVAANMAQFNTNPNGTVNEGHDMRETVSTVATKGPHQGVVETTMIEEGALPAEMMERAVKVAAFLVKYYGSEVGQHQRVDKPIDVVTTLARYAVVTVTIDAKTYVIVDIGLRMLKPRELANAQGFPPDYKLNPIVRKYLRGKWVERELTIAEQISAIGNSVCPPVARALVLANQPRREEFRLAA